LKPRKEERLTRTALHFDIACLLGHGVARVGQLQHRGFCVGDLAILIHGYAIEFF